MQTETALSETQRSLPSVPRSRGCITCVSRKTRCDGGRPTCKSCADRKQFCRGYRRSKFVFMNEGWRAPGVAHIATARETRNIHVGERKRGQEMTQGASSIADDGGSSGDSYGRLVPSKALVPDRMALYSSFFLSGFTLQNEDFTVQQLRRCFSLLCQMPSTTKPDDPGLSPVVQAAAALVQGHFGKLKSDTQIIRESACSYGRALRRLSLKLADMQCAGFHSINVRDEDWLDVVFSCLMLAFWELGMNPTSTNWQNHARGIADAIEARGPSWMKSADGAQILGRCRLFILFELLSSGRTSALVSDHWLRQQPPQWADSAEWPEMECPRAFGSSRALFGPQDYLNFVLDNLAATTHLVSQYQSLWLSQTGHPASSDTQFINKVMGLHNTAAATLQRLEKILGYWQRDVRSVPLTEWFYEWDMHETACNAIFTEYNKRLLATAHSFQDVAEYHLVGLCRTAAMSLRLLLYDILSIGSLDNAQLLQALVPTLDAAGHESLRSHRTALVRHAHAVLQAIPYGVQRQVLGIGPTCFTPWYRVARAALARECETLRAEVEDDGQQLKACLELKGLIERYLEWVVREKIAVKVDFDITWPKPRLSTW